MSSIKAYLVDLNLFQPSDGTVEDEHNHRSNIISTRIYLALLILIIIAFTLSLSFISETTRITLHHPSADQFSAIAAAGEPDCPCSQISLVYEDFVTLEASFHQVCSSDFVSDRWIRTIFSGLNASYFFQPDFRRTGSALFQALAALCRLSKDNIEQSVASFLATAFISSQALSRNLFESKVPASIEEFQESVSAVFQSQLQLVNQLIFANKLQSGLHTNTLFLQMFDGLMQRYSITAIYFEYRQTNDNLCFCSRGYDCVSPSGIYDLFSDTPDIDFSHNQVSVLMRIPGLFSGCMPMNSLLLSTLECFYNQTCVNDILSFLSVNSDFTAMTTIERSIFQPNATVQSIVGSIMVQNWTTNIYHEKYFAQCAPISCTYLVEKRHDVLFVLAKIIGLLGSLVLGLRLSVPWVVRFIRNRKMRKNQSTASPRIPCE